MKKRILALILFIAMVMAMTSCTSLFKDVQDSGIVTVVVEETDGSFSEYEIELSAVTNKDEGAKGVLDALASRDENRLSFASSIGDFGAYITEINSLRNGDAGRYITVYTSIEADAYIGSPMLDYNGTTLYQAGVGVSFMTVKDGMIILFRLESY